MARFSIRNALLGAALTTSLIGCGGSSLTPQQSTQALAAASTATSQFATQLAAAQGGGTSTVKISVNGGTTTVSGSVTNASGGTATVSGSIVTSAGTVTQDIVLGFSDWKDAAANITLSGNLKVHQSTSGTTYTGSETGDITVSGAFSGTASFAVNVSVSPGCINYSGNISGNSISTKIGC